jgi:hypothetical protein
MVSLDMIKGLTIIGIAIVVIGIIVFETGTYVYSFQSSNVQQCQLLTRELGQFLDPEVSEVCRTAPFSITMSLIAAIAGIVMIVIGGVLFGVGAFRKSTIQIAPTTTQSGQEVGPPSVVKDEHGVKDERENPIKSDIPLVADELSKLLALKEKGYSLKKNSRVSK